MAGLFFGVSDRWRSCRDGRDRAIKRVGQQQTKAKEEEKRRLQRVVHPFPWTEFSVRSWLPSPLSKPVSSFSSGGQLVVLPRGGGALVPKAPVISHD